MGKDDQFKQPDVVTELLNIQPTSKAIDHKIIKVTDNNKVYKSKESFWELATNYEESYYSSKQIEKVLSKLQGKEEILRKIYEAYNVSIILMTVVKVEGDIFPVLDMDVDLIQYLSSIHCHARFDEYYCSGIPPEENYENFAKDNGTS